MKEPKERGRCRLCLTPDVELQESHILPRFAYVRLRGNGLRPDPVHFTNGQAFQSQEQITEALLCIECEQRFGKVESQIATLLPLREGRPAPILNLLGNVFHVTAKGLRAVALGKVDGRALAYFATSVIWRASVSQHFNVELEKEHDEEFRQFLLGTAAFPSSAACVATFFDLPFDDSVDLSATSFGPQTFEQGINGLNRNHRFMVLGMQFLMQAGRELDEWVLASCVLRNGTMFLARQESLVEQFAPAILDAKVDPGLSERLDDADRIGAGRRR